MAMIPLFHFAGEKRLQREGLNLLEPSHWVLLDYPFHKSTRSSRTGCGLLIYGWENDNAKVSKSPIWVNGKIEGSANPVTVPITPILSRNDPHIKTF